MTRWFEDIETDTVYPLGKHLFTAEEIQRFGRLYDPQYFHVDAESAPQGPFGGLVASGWHTACVGHRLMVDTLEAESERLRGLGQEPGVSGPSPGVNSMVFKAPVRPGDSVEYRLIVTGKRPSASLPVWGLLFNTIEGHNRRGEPVYRSEVVAFSKLRDYRMPLSRRLLFALKRFQQKWRPVLRFGNATK